ncbi:MAG: mechanosensitive ion channel family protein, partial [Methanomassiliicoccales archaeon]|nr:mechanosensitive ion channel family protein [Methanomassiliicoccales archaeon]
MANPTLLGIDLINLLFFIGLVLLTMATARAAYALIRKASDQKVGKRISKIVANLVQYVIIGTGLAYGILIVLKLDMAALAASFGLIGIAIAFSSQQIIQNFAAGLLVAIERRVQLED